jgi:hypothetical protein
VRISRERTSTRAFADTRMRVSLCGVQRSGRGVHYSGQEYRQSRECILLRELHLLTGGYFLREQLLLGLLPEDLQIALDEIDSLLDGRRAPHSVLGRMEHVVQQTIHC